MRHLYSIIILTIALLCTPIVRAQKESSIWYFGDLAGLDFNHTPPQAISNPNMRTFEGCSSLSDTSGKLLFYSDGRTVWNKDHLVMENGSGLWGDASSTHSSIFLQRPYSTGEYYIITADAWLNTTGDPNNGVCYSEISLNHNNGAGKVTSKNNLLVPASAEKIAVTKHRNGSYFWIAIPECFTSNLHLFLLTENGFEHKVTFNNLFPVLESSWGQMKFSQDGRHLALTWPQPNNSQLSDVVVLDFNNATGAVSTSQVITGGDRLYGVEFSPNSEYLYLSTWIDKNKVCQCPVAQGTTNYLTDCKFYPQRNISGQLQLGPDQQIYIANSFKQYLGVIQFPDSAFANSGFIDSAVALAPDTKCFAGLPSLYVATERLSVSNLCLYDTGRFSISTNNIVYDSIRWYANNIKLADTLPYAYPSFTQTGFYDITVVLFSPLKTDTFSRTIKINPLPINPGLHDTTMCQNQAVVLNAYRQQDVIYKWSTGSTDSIITATTTGAYNVVLTYNGCSVTNSFLLENRPDPVVNLPDETVICAGSATTIDATQTGARYLWSTGDTTSSVSLVIPQRYWVRVTVDDCSTTDTFMIQSTTLPDVHLGDDTTICEEQSYSLNVLSPYSVYLWNTTSTEPEIKVFTAGTYSVLVTNPCGTVSDSIQITTEVCNCNVWVPNAFTPNGDQSNDFFAPQLSCNYTQYDFRVYNKWGQEIFKSNSPAVAWNGSFKGEAAPDDVYVWKLQCLMVNRGGKQFSETQNGTVTLLR